MWLLRKLSFPLSLIYALVVCLRNYLYDQGIFPSRSFETPTVCIGNLSVGGTGKTPMIEFLISQFKDGLDLVVLSRGYGRKTKGFIEATKNTRVEEIGDEPFQIQTKFPSIKVIVDEDRSNALSIIEDISKPDLILLDDAFQHRKVKPSISILLTTYDNLFVNDWYLPTGNLRDSKREVRRAHIIVVTKCPSSLKVVDQERIVQMLKPAVHQRVLFSYLEYGKQFIREDKSIGFNAIKNKKITLVTGIANPKPLLEFLNLNNVEVNHLKYKDHHFFTEREIELFNEKELILTTEKDYVRLKNKVQNMCFIPIKHKFFGEGKEEIVNAITNTMKLNP
ncbi:tetraacyldisaccharide 4'-kinase [Saonia flava]|uniref:Tetraacyldisaccharide 4'-kinase n=1 Tax=Saonia flava TaxID=523696 RepID=A0A846QRK9_9FLAO|nr:tetraacyldisaccharide 4'-kinase [Saonia flava]NJB70728.1 tetraacyldisaccharide 4'-kinase [Saonia flava]